ncbi:21597_t:CDS:1, partial [Cetraspora pellucida]
TRASDAKTAWLVALLKAKTTTALKNHFSKIRIALLCIYTTRSLA